MKKKILILVACALAVVATLCTIFNSNDDVKEYVEIIQENVIEEIKLINESTTDIPTLTETDEETLEYQETESEAFELQGEIAYNGSTEIPQVSIGEYAGLTYYSQIDSRWKDKLYTSTGNITQTMGSSACGPTCAAMVVSSIKGTILPTEMADLFVKYGFRSTSNGTYWSAFRWTADVFDIEYTEKYKLDEVCELLNNNYMVVAACGNGLFTTGGHFILIYGIEGDTLKIYDPYLYNGKFNIATRRGKATVDGNTILVSKENFRQYANYSAFFCFKNDRVEIKENSTEVTVQTIETKTFDSYTAEITAKSGLNARSGASTSYAILSGYRYGKTITIIAESNGWAKTSDGYWVCMQYISKISNTTISTVGQYKKFKSTYTYIYSNSDLTGTKYYYLKNTKVKILENVSSTVDKIYVPATGRYGYVSTEVYK